MRKKIWDSGEPVSLSARAISFICISDIGTPFQIKTSSDQDVAQFKWQLDGYVNHLCLRNQGFFHREWLDLN